MTDTTPLEESQARRIAELEAELADALTKLQGLATAVELNMGNLTAAWLKVTAGSPPLDLVRDVAEMEPTGPGADIVPLRIPGRKTTAAADAPAATADEWTRLPGRNPKP